MSTFFSVPPARQSIGAGNGLKTTRKPIRKGNLYHRGVPLPPPERQPGFNPRQRKP